MNKPCRWAIVTLSAVLALAAFRDLGPYPDRYASCLFLEQSLELGFFVWAALSDLDDRIIPNISPLGAVLAHVALMAPLCAIAGVSPWVPLGRSLVGAAVLGGGILAFTVGYECLAGRTAMGGGDVKLVFAIGFVFGWERGMLVLALACIGFVLAVGLAQLAQSFIRGRVAAAAGGFRPGISVAPDTAHPFAPALAIAVYVVLLCF